MERRQGWFKARRGTLERVLGGVRAVLASRCLAKSRPTGEGRLPESRGPGASVQVPTTPGRVLDPPEAATQRVPHKHCK